MFRRSFGLIIRKLITKDLPEHMANGWSNMSRRLPFTLLQYDYNEEAFLSMTPNADFAIILCGAYFSKIDFVSLTKPASLLKCFDTKLYIMVPTHAHLTVSFVSTDAL